MSLSSHALVAAAARGVRAPSLSSVNLTPNEVLIISLVALVALGPKQLPQVTRQLAKGAAQLRRFSSQVKTELESAIDDAVAESHGRDLERQQAESTEENEDATATGEEE